MNREKDIVNYAVVFFAAVSCLLLIFPSTKIVHTLRLIISYSLYPSLKHGFQYNYYIKNVPSNFLRLIEVDQENRELSQKIKDMELSIARTQVLEDENKRFSEILNLSRRIPWKGVWARVVNKNPLDYYNTFFIDKGSKHSIAPNSTIIAVENRTVGLVGRIFEVYPEFSKVLLITDRMSSVVCNFGENKFEGLIEGKGTGLLRLNYAPEESKIIDGMEVFVSLSSLMFPAGILIGKISKVYPRESFMNFVIADITPAINVNSVKEVFVISMPLPEVVDMVGGGMEK
jgi:rod shape-determining protein MreC